MKIKRIPDELEGGELNPVDVVALPSAAIMENVRDVAGRVGGHVQKSPYRSTGFVPGQVETFEMVNPTDLDAELGFPAHAVIVDNPTKQFIFIPSAQRTVGPGVMGEVLQVTRAATKAQARWRAPAGVANPAIATATTATLQFHEAYLMPASGTIPVPGGS